MSFNVKVEYTEDEYDCDTCGCNYAHSCLLTATDSAGRVVFTYGGEAVASCFGNTEYTDTECFTAFIEWLGHRVEDPYASHSDASGSFSAAKAVPEGEEE